MEPARKNKPWLKHYPPGIPDSLNYPDVPLHKILENAAQKYPKNAAIAFQNQEISYSVLNEIVNKFSSSLISLKVQKGDRVAVYLPNIPQFVIAYYGIMKAGAVVTTISPLHKEREIEHQILNAEARTIITNDKLYPTVKKIWPKIQLKTAIVTGDEDFAPITKTSSRVQSFQQILEAKESPPKIPINPNVELAALQFTGGTTGKSKGAMLTHKNIVSNTIAFATWIAGAPNDAFLTALPLYHIYGMTTSMNVPISLGAKMVLLPRFETTTALSTIQNHRITVFCGVPTMYAALLSNPEIHRFNLKSIRICISGASPLPPNVQQNFMNATNGLLAEGYGLTEASPVTHCNPVDITLQTVKVGSIGLPLPDTDACILDLESGTKKLKPGETGELAVKGPQVMQGYWRNPYETTLVLREGWLLTGDIARMDPEGYFYITDRKKDLIKYKDYSVYPRELEDILYEHSAVRLCAVIGKHNPIAGEIPKAFLVLKEGTKATAMEIMDFVKERVASYKQIREVEFRTELPISPAGKVLKRNLKTWERQSRNV